MNRTINNRKDFLRARHALFFHEHKTRHRCIRYTMKKRKSKNNHEKMIHTLELPRDLFLGVPIFTMNGDGELLIENHKGILKYSLTEIQVSAKTFPIQIIGENLSIEYYTADTLKICGKINQINLCP